MMTNTYNITPANHAVSFLSNPYLPSFSMSFAVKQCSTFPSSFYTKLSKFKFLPIIPPISDSPTWFQRHLPALQTIDQTSYLTLALPFSTWSQETRLVNASGRGRRWRGNSQGQLRGKSCDSRPWSFPAFDRGRWNRRGTSHKLHIGRTRRQTYGWANHRDIFNDN